MKKRHMLGQHFLRNNELIYRIVDEASISKNSTVLEIGTGEGYLTEKLCLKADKVVSIELDNLLFEIAKNRLKKYKNLELIHGSFLRYNKNFDILVSNLPYSKSYKFIEWLSMKQFDHAVITVQKEFADKLLSEPGQKNYKALTILSRYKFNINRLFNIDNLAFIPNPKIISTVILIRNNKDRNCNKKTFYFLKRLFSYRKKKVITALRNLLKEENPNLIKITEICSNRILQNRVEKLSITNAMSLAKILSGEEF